MNDSLATATQNRANAPRNEDKAPVQQARLSWRGLLVLSKLRLSFLVVFSGALAFVLGSRSHATWMEILAFCAAGLSTTISANIVNQILERKPDALMSRTKGRPLATGEIEPAMGWVLVFAFLVLGLGLYIAFFNVLSMSLGLFSWLLYGFIYTPLKKITPLAVAVGAFPGAMPPLIGYASATGRIDVEIILWFVIQFVWQFPHFWSIAWVLDDDYRRGGFRLLPAAGNEPGNTSAWLMMMYTFLLLPVALTPYVLGFATASYAIVSILAGLAFLYVSINLLRHTTTEWARKLMFASFFYLPVIQISLLVFTK